MQGLYDYMFQAKQNSEKTLEKKGVSRGFLERLELGVVLADDPSMQKIRGLSAK